MEFDLYLTPGNGGHTKIKQVLATDQSLCLTKTSQPLCRTEMTGNITAHWWRCLLRFVCILMAVDGLFVPKTFFGDGESNGPTSGWTKSKMAAGRHLGKFRSAISPERIVQSTSCLILWWGFRGRRIEWRYFRLDQIEDHGRQPSCIILNGHISETVHPVLLVFGSSLG